jgi:hypothetical protein
MVCYITCAFAVAFIVASLYIMFTTSKKEYKNDPALAPIYQKIVQERMKIYWIATIVGAIFGLVYLFVMKNKQSTWAVVCAAVLVFFITQWIVYMIYPKSDYILNYVTNGEQAKQWLETYNDMMRKFWIGFFIGLIGYGLLCLALVR